MSPDRAEATGAFCLVVVADVHETLDEPETGLDPAIPIASTAGIQAVADMTVKPVAVAVMAVAVMAVAMMAAASESNAGSEHDQGGSNTKSSFPEHSYLL